MISDNIRYRKFRDDPLQFLEDIKDDPSKIVKMKYYTQDIVVVTDPLIARDILGRDFQQFSKIGGGFFNVTKQTRMNNFEFRDQIHLALPFFQRFVLDDYSEIIKKHIYILINKISENIEFELVPEVNHFALATIFEIVTGLYDEDLIAEIYKIVTRGGDLVFGFATNNPLKNLISYKKRQEMKELTVDMQNILAGLIEEIQSRDVLDESIFLHYLVKHKDNLKLDSDTIADELFTLLVAGYKTTSVSIIGLLYHLAKDKTFQNRLREEVIDFNSKYQYVGQEEFSNFDLLKASILEILRIRPPAWSIYRKANMDYTVGDDCIPENSLVLISPWIYHRTKKYWDDPEKFIPNRFINQKNYRGVFLPFGRGPSKCIGRDLAMFEISIFIDKLIQKFEFTLPEPDESIDQNIFPRITLKIGNDFKLKFKPLQHILL